MITRREEYEYKGPLRFISIRLPITIAFWSSTTPRGPSTLSYLICTIYTIPSVADVVGHSSQLVGAPRVVDTSIRRSWKCWALAWREVKKLQQKGGGGWSCTYAALNGRSPSTFDFPALVLRLGQRWGYLIETRSRSIGSSLPLTKLVVTVHNNRRSSLHIVVDFMAINLLGRI